MVLYEQQKSLPKEYIQRKIKEFLEEDMPAGDITTIGTVKESQTVTAIIEAQQDLVFAGELVIPTFFEGNKFKVEMIAKDGDALKNGDLIAKVTGPADEILTLERPMLNLIQRLCGIATQTAKYVAIAKPHGVHILDTRKTTPGLRLFEKYAVACGGGTNHRLDLSAGILIKDNHIAAAGSVGSAVSSAKKKFPDKIVEVEVENFNQIVEAYTAGADAFLLDNMNPETTVRAVELIRETDNGKDLFIESSGGITYETLPGYVTTGVNAISIGALTHSVKAADIHVEFE